MALKKFEARNLKFIDDGAFVEQFDAHIEMQMRDMRGRPTDERPRTITMEIEMIPFAGGNGKLKFVNAQFRVKSKSPFHKSDPVQLGVDADGDLMFNEHSMASVDQASFLPDGEDD